MSLPINGNSFISLLRVQATYDLSGTIPVINLTNLSTGGNLAAVTYAFTAIAPDGTFIHQGNINTPDKSGVWSSAILSGTFPQPNYQIEWGIYEFQVIAKDGDGNIFECPIQLTDICRPFGNNNLSQDTYGVASSTFKLNCNQGTLFFRDTTNYSYKGLTYIKNASVLKVLYPIDGTGNVPAPFQISAYTSSIVPVNGSGKNYQYYQYSIYTYNFGNDTFITIRYTFSDTFPVYCNISLEPLICEINKLTDNLISGNCEDAVKTNLLLNAIMGKFSLCMIGLLQPETNIDVPEIIEEIKALGGFDCDCCSSNTGIIATGNSVIDGYNFLVNKLGGDATASWSITGNNITLNYGDVSYIVTVDANTHTAFPSISFTPTTSGSYQKTYSLTINPVAFGNDILTTIQSSTTLTNLLISIINNAGGIVPSLSVDGGCVISTSASCNYTFTLEGFSSDATTAYLKSIISNGVTKQLTFSFTRLDLTALDVYLNSLGIGTFSSTLSGDNIIVTSTANGNNLVDLTFKLSTNTLIADSTKTCSGYIAKTATELVQAIIYYICGIDDSKVITSQEYTICNYHDKTNTVSSTIFPQGTEVGIILNELSGSQCDLANSVANKLPLNCSNVKGLFTPNLLTMNLADYVLGVKSGACSQITLYDLMIGVFTNAAYNQEAINAICNVVSLCGAGKVCTQYSLLNVSTVLYDTSCPILLDYVYAKTSSSITINSTQFGNDASGTIQVKVRIKLTSSSTWGSYSSPQNLVFSTGNGVGILSSVISFTGLSSGTYDVQVDSVCNDTNFITKQITI